MNTHQLKIGDRVRFNQYYRVAATGDEGVVTRTYSSGCVDVCLDIGSEVVGILPFRVDRVAPFKVGQRVLVARKVTKEAGWDNEWVSSMDEVVGTTQVVKGVTSTGVQCEGRFEVFPSSALTLIAEAPRPYVFEVGDKGLTRGGSPYTVIYIHDSAEQPVVAEVDHTDCSGIMLETYTSAGCYHLSGIQSPSDLLPPKKLVMRYCNVDRTGLITGNYPTLPAAVQMAHPDSALIAHPVTFELP